MLKKCLLNLPLFHEFTHQEPRIHLVATDRVKPEETKTPAVTGTNILKKDNDNKQDK